MVTSPRVTRANGSARVEKAVLTRPLVVLSFVARRENRYVYLAELNSLQFMRGKMSLIARSVLAYNNQVRLGYFRDLDLSKLCYISSEKDISLDFSEYL